MWTFSAPCSFSESEEWTGVLCSWVSQHLFICSSTEMFELCGKNLLEVKELACVHGCCCHLLQGVRMLSNIMSTVLIMQGERPWADTTLLQW